MAAVPGYLMQEIVLLLPPPPQEMVERPVAVPEVLAEVYLLKRPVFPEQQELIQTQEPEVAAVAVGRFMLTLQGAVVAVGVVAVVAQGTQEARATPEAPPTTLLLTVFQ